MSSGLQAELVRLLTLHPSAKVYFQGLEPWKEITYAELYQIEPDADGTEAQYSIVVG